MERRTNTQRPESPGQGPGASSPAQAGPALAGPVNQMPPEAAAEAGAADLAASADETMLVVDGSGGGGFSLAPAVPIAVVVGPQRGFRRAGRAFGPDPVLIPVDELSREEMEALMGEPQLVVSIRYPD